MKRLSRKYLEIAKLFLNEAYLLGCNKEENKYAYIAIDFDYEKLPSLKESVKYEEGLNESEEQDFAVFVLRASEIIKAYGSADEMHLKEYAKEIEPAVRWLTAKLNGKLEDFENDKSEEQPDLCKSMS